MTDYTDNQKSKQIIALYKAAAKVRQGDWLNASLTVFPLMLTELEKDGWQLLSPDRERLEELAKEWERDDFEKHKPEDLCIFCDERRKAYETLNRNDS